MQVVGDGLRADALAREERLHHGALAADAHHRALRGDLLVDAGGELLLVLTHEELDGEQPLAIPAGTRLAAAPPVVAPAVPIPPQGA